LNSKKLWKNYQKHIPNGLSMLRLLLVAPFIFGIYTINTTNYPQNWQIAVTALFLSIITSDVLDGFIARKLQFTSVRGAKLDIIADAFYIISSLALFAYLRIIPAWFVAVILAKCAEFILTSKIINKKSQNKKGVAVFDKIGKTSISATMLLPGVFLLRNAINYQFVMGVLVYILTITLLISFLHRIYIIIQLKSED